MPPNAPPRFPELDRAPLSELWVREDRQGNRIEIVPRGEMELLLDESGVNPELLAKLVGLALGKYRRLDQRGLKTELRRDARDIIEDFVSADGPSS